MKKLTKENNFCKAVWKQNQNRAERKVVKRIIKGWIVKKQKQNSIKYKTIRPHVIFVSRSDNLRVCWLHFAVRPKDNRRRINFLKV